MLAECPKHVIFDMDGLMFDTENLCFSCEQKAAEEFGYSVSKELFLKTLGVNHSAYCRIMRENLGENFPALEVSALTYRKMDDFIEKNGVPVKPGLYELLRQLDQMRIPCSVASSSHADRVRHLLQKAEIFPYFQQVIGGNMVTRSKPEPDIFLAACRAAGISPSHSLVLEDSPNGLTAARRANIPSICIPDLVRPSQEILQYTSAVLSDLYEVCALFQDFHREEA